MIARVATIVWFAVYGLSYWVAFPSEALILAVVALVIAIAMIAGK